MQLTEKFQWLETIGTLPKLVSAGLQYLGVREIKGVANNPAIMEMANALGLSKIYVSDDKQSWCALFLNYLIRITDKPRLNPDGDLYNLLRAKYLLNWGKPVQKGDERLGDLMIFNREGGGHVGLLIAQTGSTYWILGGNQNDCVNFTEIAKDRLIGARRYYATGIPTSAKHYTMDSSGKLSVNES